MIRIILIILPLLLMSCSQSKNLTLVCDGTLTAKNVVKESIKTEIRKTTNTYIFEDGGVKGIFLKSNCNWDKEQINCIKNDTDEAISTLKFDRISGLIQFHHSLIGYTSDSFEGSCKKDSIKF